MIWILLSVFITIIDQVTKHFVLQNIGIGEMIPVIDKFFYLTLYMNSGAAFSILKDGRPFFLVITPIVAILIIFIMFKNKNRFLSFTLAIILGGTMGNYIDRVVAGEVTDFLLFYIGSYPFPVFNVADIALTCGTILIGIYVTFFYKEPEKKGKTGIAAQSEIEEDSQLGEETGVDPSIAAAEKIKEDSNKDAQ